MPVSIGAGGAAMPGNSKEGASGVGAGAPY